jgi:hypothetical protein
VILLEPRTLHQSAKLKNVPKNEYLFTLFSFFVNQNVGFLSAAKSIECSWFTAPCRILVQSVHQNFENPRCFRAFSQFLEIQDRFPRRTHANLAVWKSRLKTDMMRVRKNQKLAVLATVGLSQRPPQIFSVPCASKDLFLSPKFFSRRYNSHFPFHGGIAWGDPLAGLQCL